jgi:succinate dehydrogenase hydrophobic anchor subunit
LKYKVYNYYIILLLLLLKQTNKQMSQSIQLTEEQMTALLTSLALPVLTRHTNNPPGLQGPLIADVNANGAFPFYYCAPFMHTQM